MVGYEKHYVNREILISFCSSVNLFEINHKCEDFFMIYRILFKILIIHTLKEVPNGDYLKKARKKPNIGKGPIFSYVQTNKMSTQLVSITKGHYVFIN